MALAIQVASSLSLPVKNGGAVYIPPDVTAAPKYVPEITSTPIPPNPVIAPPPEGQIKGTGGTIFGIVSGAIKPPVTLAPYIMPTMKEPLYDLPDNDAYAPMAPYAPLIQAKPPAGTQAYVTPPKVPAPVKSNVPPVVTSVPSLGPITGKVAGFDLATVPLWAWLLGAAVLGARLLR